ncbi:MAG: hypothetical protein ACTSX9_03755 [Candidatus Njordarchaeales archaeon]
MSAKKDFKLVTDTVVYDLNRFLKELELFLNTPYPRKLLNEEKVVVKTAMDREIIGKENRFIERQILIKSSRGNIIGFMNVFSISRDVGSILRELKYYEPALSKLHGLLKKIYETEYEDRSSAGEKVFLVVIYLRKDLPKILHWIIKNLVLSSIY